MRNSWSHEQEEELVKTYESLLPENGSKIAFRLTADIIGRTYDATRLRYYRVKNYKDEDTMEETETQIVLKEESLLDVFKQFVERTMGYIESTVSENISLKSTVEQLQSEKSVMQKEIETVLKYIKIASTHNTLEEIGISIEKPRFIMQNNGNLERV